MLVKHPGLAAISILALALGIGLTATMWSITYGGILRGLPFEQADRIMHLERTRPSHGIDSYPVPIHDYSAWRESQRSFEDLSAWYQGTVNISGAQVRPERYEGAFITASAFRLLRVAPLLGRTFTDGENQPGAPDVAVIGYDVWQNRFGGDSSVVGRTMRANGRTVEIIGVMPRGFLFPTQAKVWLPLRLDPVALPWGTGASLEVMGRLKPGVSRAEARDDIDAICRRLALEHPKENEGVSSIVKPFTEEYVGEQPIIMLWTMMAAVFGVLLIACANVANLLLARAAVRTKEVAIRTALGASRWRVVAQLLTEALVLSITGALLGLGIAAVGIRLFNNALVDTQPPFWIHIALDLPVLVFVVGITMMAALISGVLPALQATRTNIHDVLKDESRGASSLRMGRFSKGLVMAELALSGGLLVGAGFMIQSVVQLSHFDYGVPTRNVFTARVGLFEATYPDSAARGRFWNDLEARLAALPGQRGTALTTVLPGLGAWYQRFALEGTTYETDRDYPSTRRVAVTPGWFDMFHVAALEGRVLGSNDIAGTLPVAVVTRGFVRKYLGEGPALGRRFRLGDAESTAPWLTVVGVVPDVWFDGTDDHPLRAAVITPIAQGDFAFLSIAVAAPADPMSFAEPVRSAVTGIDGDQPIYFAQSLHDAIARDGWFYGVVGTLFMVFGAAALFLATVGVYGVMSFAVSRRIQEIGVRMALGAGARDVLRLFLRQGVLQVAVGLVLGLGLAVLLTKGLTLVLFQVDTKNPMMYAVVGATLALTGLLATLIPARRATKVDPLHALRYD